MEATTCARCGGSFGCGARQDGCWCASLPPLVPVVEGRSCLCRACLVAELGATAATDRAT